MFIRRAASRVKARNPEVASWTFRPEACRTIQLPSRCRRRLTGEKCASFPGPRSPTTRSARPARIGATRAGMSAGSYWRAEPGVLGEADDPVGEPGAARLGGPVGRAVVDDQDRDLGEAGEAPRQRRQRGRQRRFLLPGGNLDDELHRERPGALPIVISIYDSVP